MEWMENHNPIDQDDEDGSDSLECLLENWNHCFQYRTAMIEKAGGDVDVILNAWPALNNSYGFTLVSGIKFDTNMHFNGCVMVGRSRFQKSF